MKIFSSNINFTARNKNIRQADDIMRISLRNFPMQSATYMDKFYKSDSDLKKKKVKEISESIKDSRIKVAEASCLHPECYSNMADNYMRTIVEAQKTRKGNCYEKSIATLATFLAESIDNFSRCNLDLKIEIFDKKTKKLVNSCNSSIDHTLLISGFNNNQKDKNKRFIIIDPWLGFVKSESEARGIYKIIFANDIAKKIKRQITKLKVNSILTNKEFNPDNYVYRTKILFKVLDDMTECDKKALREQVLTVYPELLTK